MLELRIVRPSRSPFASSLHMVPKKNGYWRPCHDYRLLNAHTVPDRYSLPHVHAVNYHVSGCSIFLKIDLVRAYHQISMHADDIGKTAIITRFGSFESLSMPFGLRNVGQTFQRFIDDVMRGLDFVSCYIDDLLISSSSQAEHLSHLRKVFPTPRRRRHHHSSIQMFLGCPLWTSSGIASHKIRILLLLVIAQGNADQYFWNLVQSICATSCALCMPSFMIMT